MIETIRKFNNQSSESSRLVNPDDYFDPSTHIATEADFIAFLEAGGKYNDKSLVGYKVQLSNTVDYNNGIWVIADVNHNIKQPNTYDLISQDVFHSRIFSANNQYWRDSDIRTWLNSTFYNGFSENFKSHMNNITYDSNGSTYNDDKVILPSKVEVKGGTKNVDREGTAYPIFIDSSSRKKYLTGTTSYDIWWTRSRYTNHIYGVWGVNLDGDLSDGYYKGSLCLAPILRIS